LIPQGIDVSSLSAGEFSRFYTQIRNLTVVTATNPEVMKEKLEMLTNAAAVTASMFVTNTLQAYTLKPEQTGSLGDEN